MNEDLGIAATLGESECRQALLTSAVTDLTLTVTVHAGTAVTVATACLADWIAMTRLTDLGAIAVQTSP